MTDTMTTQYPRGWFVVAFSEEIPKLGVKALEYFGEQLVAFRGEDGEVRVLDAYCAHMGANLAAGGKVVDNSIECPFHAWRYCGTGECVEIPYAKKIPPKARQRAWTVREVNGVVLVWHDARAFEALQRRGMAQDLSWRLPAATVRSMRWSTAWSVRIRSV